MKRILVKSKITLVTSLCFVVLMAGSAHGVGYFNQWQIRVDFLGYYLPTTQFPAKGVESATIGPNGTAMFPAQSSAAGNPMMSLYTPATWKYTDGAGNFNLLPYRTYVTGGAPACLNLGNITGHQMPATPSGAPGILATLDSIYCGAKVGMQAGTLAPGSGPAVAGPFRWCFNASDPVNPGPCTLTDGGGGILPASQQPMEMNITKHPGAAAYGGTRRLAGLWNLGVRLSNPFTPAGGYWDYWGVLPLSTLGGFGTTRITAAITHETLGVRMPGPVTEVAVPWSTGMMTNTFWYSNPTAMLALNVVTQHEGFDNRTSMYEAGEVQLVSAFHQQWVVFGVTSRWAIPIVQNILFVPEAGMTGLLTAGLLMLPAVYWRRNRKR